MYAELLNGMMSGGGDQAPTSNTATSGGAYSTANVNAGGGAVGGGVSFGSGGLADNKMLLVGLGAAVVLFLAMRKGGR